MTPGTPPRIAVAYSGGRDSTALLHAVASMAARAWASAPGPALEPGCAAPQGLEVIALHVHHGLQPQADAWLAHCQAQCEAWAHQGLPVRLAWHHLHLSPRPGESIEAVARQARYAALARMARQHDACVVALAHHRRDQAETFLLQALRGAGTDGLSSMPGSIERDGLTWVRPWLNQPREAIESYVHLHGLAHIDDTSNTDRRYLRNRLRLQVWPALALAFPAAERSLSAAARHAQDSSECATALAQIDMAALIGTRQEGTLDVRGLLALSAARRRNVLRHWYRARSGRVMPGTAVDRLCAELAAEHGGQWPVPGRPGHVLRVHRGELLLVLQAPNALDDAALGAERTIDLSAPGISSVAIADWGGTLHLEPVASGGVPRALLAHARLMQRQGGEQFQLAPGRPPRQLKKQFQAAGVPAWQRSGPLVYAGELLVYVPGLGIDARAWAQEGTPDQLGLRWEPDPVA